MGKREKRTLQLWLILILLVAVVTMATAVLIQSFYVMLVALALIAFDLYWFYVRYHKRVKPKYPMAPPDAEPVDAYFPRTNIPRPIYADAAKMREKQKKLDHMRKMRKKKGRA